MGSKNLDLPEVYAIVDRDDEREEIRSIKTKLLQWDVYHIENYLLEPLFIQKVLRDNQSYASELSEDEIEAQLLKSASEVMHNIVRHEMNSYVNQILKKCLDLGFDQSSREIAREFSDAIDRVSVRVSKKGASSLSRSTVDNKASEIEKKTIGCAS